MSPIGVKHWNSMSYDTILFILNLYLIILFLVKLLLIIIIILKYLIYVFNSCDFTKRNVKELMCINLEM